ncbi:hypothetical protein UFOVP707_17 [uncultured Caudovirales phage]|uniref:Uncharacterized protein n=1 Tax=uncultured Caudovirales phage TaxID=2100421 RepID=A0A6J5NNB7_9CAUD|nr:hypothetical protein UFOVP707_17 [uncultured Caudovirales phage]
MKHQHIGFVTLDTLSIDSYLLITFDEADIAHIEHDLEPDSDEARQHAVEALISEHCRSEALFREGGPGQSFCRNYTLIGQRRDNQFVIAMHVRWDV